MRRKIAPSWIAFFVAAGFLFQPAPAHAGFFKKVFHPVVEVKNKAVDGAKDVAHGAVEAKNKAVDGAKDVAHGAVEAKNAVVDGAKDVAHGAVEAKNAVVDGAKDAGRAVGGEARERIRQVGQDVRAAGNDFSHECVGKSLEDVGHVISDVVPGAGTPVIAVARAGERTVQEGKIANKEFHNGAYGRGLEHMGHAATNAGEGVAVVAPSVGALIIAAGEGTQVAARQGQLANVVAHDVAVGRLGQAAKDGFVVPLQEAVDQGKQALDAASHGQLGQAAEHLGQAANSVAPGSGKTAVEVAQAAQSAGAQERGAIADLKDGKLGEAGKKAGGSVAAAGDVIAHVDGEKGEKLKTAGQNMADVAAKAQAVVRAVREGNTMAAANVLNPVPPSKPPQLQAK